MSDVPYPRVTMTTRLFRLVVLMTTLAVPAVGFVVSLPTVLASLPTGEHPLDVLRELAELIPFTKGRLDQLEAGFSKELKLFYVRIPWDRIPAEVQSELEHAARSVIASSGKSIPTFVGSMIVINAPSNGLSPTRLIIQCAGEKDGKPETLSVEVPLEDFDGPVRWNEWAHDAIAALKDERRETVGEPPPSEKKPIRVTLVPVPLAKKVVEP